MQQNNQEPEKIYYIEAITGAATRIGKTMIMPGKAPIAFTEKAYNAHRRHIDHYEQKGTIMVSRPDTKDSVRAARAVKAEQEELERIEAGGTLPPPPMVRRYGDPPPMPNTIPEMPTFSTPDDDSKCVAVTGKGTRCKTDAVENLLVCKIHMNMLKKDKDVISYDGRRIAKDGKTYTE